MNTKINFVNRNELTTNNQNPKKVDAQKIIDYYLSLHPLNRVKVNSPLYNLAIQQYNENIKNTLIRPDVPEWFCGKINPDTGELDNQSTDEQRRASAGVISDPLQPTSVVPVGIEGAYLPDECLYNGTPGSAGYLKCTTGVDAQVAQELVDEWLSSIESDKKEIGELELMAAFEETESQFIDIRTSSKFK